MSELSVIVCLRHLSLTGNLRWCHVEGGSPVVMFDGTAYTESICRITVSLMNRGVVIYTPDYPPAPYIENIGVRPDIVLDYMTRENLMTGGQSFVQAFTQSIVTLTQY